MGIIGVGIGATSLTLMDEDINLQNLANHTKKPDITPDESNPVPSEEKKLPEENIEALALQSIDELAAHPSDPQNSFDVTGVSDEELASIDPEDIQNLLEITLSHANKNSNPRYLYALGRAAWIHDYPQGVNLLQQATERGSAAAKAYLARTKDDLQEMQTLLQDAVQGGFSPASDWLAEVNAALQEEQRELNANKNLDYNIFALPVLIKALHDKDYDLLDNNLLGVIPYLSALNDSANDMLLYIEDQTGYMREMDPNITFRLEKKMAQSPEFIGQAADAGMSMLKNMFLAMGQAHQQNQSPQEMIVNLNRSIYGGPDTYDAQGNPTKGTILEFKQHGTKDGKVLALLFNENPDAFRRIYTNLKEFVRYR